MNKKNKGGRPSIKLTKEQKSELETLAAVLNVEQIADYFGISRRVFYDIMERDEEVSAQYKKGKAKAVGFVAQNLIQKARGGDLGAQIFYLKTQAGWKETQKFEGSGNDGEHVIAYKWMDNEDEDN
jgi:predicted DNA-binding transcriptional regulator AlpA